MSLAEAATSRKERLEALRKRKAGDAPVDGETSLRIKQRNFDPATRAATKFSAADLPTTIESQVKGVSEQIVAADEAKRAEELNLLNIAPKRPNWDLKRDLDRITKKLQPQTDDAIKAVIRARLTAQAGAGGAGAEGGMDVSAALGAMGGLDEASRAGDDDEDDEDDEDAMRA